MSARLALVAVAAITLVGCAGGAVTPAARPVAGAPAVVTRTGVASGLVAVASSYTLVAIDGHALPYARVNPKEPTPSPTQVVSGVLTLDANGTFVITTKYREVEAKGERLFDGKFGGVCSPDGDGFRMYWEGGGETLLTASGDTVTVNNDGVLYRYLRNR